MNPKTTAKERDSRQSRASVDVSPTDEEREILVRVLEIIRRVRYGAVALVIHDGKVMQVETEEKFRLR